MTRSGRITPGATAIRSSKTFPFPCSLTSSGNYPADGVPQRATYIVNPEGVIQFVYVTTSRVGRNPEEVLRVLDALQSKELCPSNWHKGEPTLKVA